MKQFTIAEDDEEDAEPVTDEQGTSDQCTITCASVVQNTYCCTQGLYLNHEKNTFWHVEFHISLSVCPLC